MASGSERYAGVNAKVKAAISERTAAGFKKTPAKRRAPKAGGVARMSRATRDSIPF